MSSDLKTLQNNIGIHFKDEALLQQALTHRSYLNEAPVPVLISNERLEFLGDASLGLIIAEMLFRDYPDLAEGEMTKLKAEVVCSEALADIARTLKLGDCLYLGHGEDRTGGRRRQSNLANVMESLIGAIFIDQGFEVTKKFVLDLFADVLQTVIKVGKTTDYKSHLQELTQEKRRLVPVYRVVDITGPDHAREFTVEVLVKDIVIGRGKGKSKQIAENEAARDALREGRV